MRLPKPLDLRPALSGWIPGNYATLCTRCQEHFTGDKRAWQCADCAYELNINPQPTRTEKWDRRFLQLAKQVASWSKDPSTKVGAVIARDDLTVVSLGFNGFPRGIPDLLEDYEDREVKYSMIVHAEANAIVHARWPVQGCTIYTWPMPPCADCTKLIIQSGIKRAVSCIPSIEQKQRWGKSFDTAKKMLSDSGVELMLYAPDYNPPPPPRYVRKI